MGSGPLSSPVCPPGESGKYGRKKIQGSQGGELVVAFSKTTRDDRAGWENGEAGRGWVQGHRSRDGECVSYMEVPRCPHNAINSVPSVVRENRRGRGGERYRKIPER